MKYMVIERIRPGMYDAVYERFHAKGRLLPDGLHYIDSWVTQDKTTCYQLMESDSPELFEPWFARWNDLVEFELHPLRESPT